MALELEGVFWAGFNNEQLIGLVVVVGLDDAGSSTASLTLVSRISSRVVYRSSNDIRRRECQDNVPSYLPCRFCSCD